MSNPPTPEPTPEPPPERVVDALGLRGCTFVRIGAGHVNRTFIAGAATRPIAVLQRINDAVFADVDGLMENALLVAAAVSSAGGSPLRYRRTPDGSPIARDESSAAWRAYDFVEGSTRPIPSSTGDATRIGTTYGAFDAALAGVDPDRFHITIPHFHDLAHRTAAFSAAIEHDPVDRLAQRTEDVDRLLALLNRLDQLDELKAWDELPTRVAHHDAKPPNLVVPSAGAPTTVIDVDTVMPGTLLSDIGELVRSCARTKEEDDPTGVFRCDHAIGAMRGFLRGWGRELSAAELAAAPAAGLWATVQNATRFLTDHLEGDTYFAVDFDDHNLDRFRAMAGQAEANLASIDELRRAI